MQHEFEAKCLIASVADARERLERMGATCVRPERTFHRMIFDFPGRTLAARGGYVRVRDEGGRMTMSYKQMPTDAAIEDCFETELIIHSFADGVAFCEDIGMIRKSEQETKRESWEGMGTKCEIDQWPGIPPYLEVEGPDEATVRKAVTALGYAWEEVRFGGVGVLYKLFLGIPEDAVNDIPVITFAHPPVHQVHGSA